ncbi:MAG TPA: tetratricopeptide repeat protein, partial [Vicinamibacterales bacterium]
RQGVVWAKIHDVMGSSPRRPSWLPLAAIFVLALVLRLLHAWVLERSVLGLVPIGDAIEYDAWAQRIAAGDWLGSEVFYQAPLYPYFLAVLFKLFGHSLHAVRIVQSVLGAVSGVGVAWAGRRFFDERVGIMAGVLLALYAPAIFFDGLIQKSSLDLFLIAMLLALLGEFHARGGMRWIVIAGVALGLLALNRENARVLYPVICVWLLTRGTRRVRHAVVFTFAMLVVLLPVGIRNYRVGGEFLVSTSQLGPNFYIGNNSGATGEYAPLVAGHGTARLEAEDARALAEQATGRPLTPSEVSDYWLQRAIADIRDDPWRWKKLTARKVALTLGAAEIPDSESIEAYASDSPALYALRWLDFGVLLPLAVLGAWMTRDRWRELGILYAIVVTLVLAVAAFYVFARYRYPLVPVLVPFAAAGIVVPWRVRQWRSIVPGVIAAIIVAVAMRIPLHASTDETFLNVSKQLVREQRWSEADDVLRRVIARQPDDSEAHFNLGVALNGGGDKAAALAEFETAVRRSPSDPAAQASLALALNDAGRPSDALPHFREAARLAPTIPENRTNLGLALLSAGLPAEASAEFAETLRLQPDSIPASFRLAEALARAGRPADAAAVLDYARTIALRDGRTQELAAIDQALAQLRR